MSSENNVVEFELLGQLGEELIQTETETAIVAADFVDEPLEGCVVEKQLCDVTAEDYLERLSMSSTVLSNDSVEESADCSGSFAL